MHQKLRTKALVLELLAAICLVKGGHEIILAAFDHLKLEMGEAHRFQTLMIYFANPDSFQIEFMVACMQFINIVVHSVEDMNFRQVKELGKKIIYSFDGEQKCKSVLL